MSCPGCEQVPEQQQGAGTLYILPAQPHAAATIAEAVIGKGWPLEREGDSVLSVPVPEGEIGTVMGTLNEALTPQEQAACLANFFTEGDTWSPQALLATRPLDVLVARSQSQWLSDLIDEQRLQMHFQPIVHADDGRTVFAYESLARGLDADGGLISPGELFPAARAANLMFHLDRAARVSAIRQSHQHGIRHPVFINFNPTAVYDPGFCLRTTFKEVRRLGIEPHNFVFEVVETDSVADEAHLKSILEEYRRQGFRIALDDLGAGFGSLTLMKQIRPDFIKLDRELVDGVHWDRYKAAITSHLIEMGKTLQVQIIAEGIEQAEDWHWLRERGVHYVQGFYFARPASPPPTLD